MEQISTTYFYISYKEFVTLINAYEEKDCILLYGNGNDERVLISKDAYIKLRRNYRKLDEELVKEVC